MTKFLKDLLGNDHPLFSANIQELERATGNAGVDTKLIGDITEKAHEIMRSLKLDPADTTGEELYQAIRNATSSSQANNILVGSEFILINLGDGPVSLNLQDAIENMHHELSYQDRTVSHAQRHLRLEVVKRYAEHDRTDNTLVHKLTEQINVKQPDDASYPVVEKADNNQAPFILAIGDIFTDAFIKLEEDEAAVFKDEDGKKHLIMPFGSKPPYERVDIVQGVGPSPNAAVAFSRLGVRAGLMAYLGDDQPGKDSIDYLHTQQIDTSTVSVQAGIKSNYYYVLRYGAERTILVKNEAYNYLWMEPATTPDWIYLALVSEDAWQLHMDMLKYLEAHPDTKLAFQPGTFHFKWGVEKLAPIYARSHIVVMNREEAVDVTGQSYDSLPDLANALHNLGPHIVVITDGQNGSYASYDGKMVMIPNYPDPAPPFDRTGAGDAFASTIVAGLALGESMDTALTWAPINSMNVVQKLGAQEGLLTKDKIQELLTQAPEDYKVKEI